MTANQLERFARAHRQVTAADDASARVQRRLVWRVEEDGSLTGTFRLPPLQGAVLLKALRAACADLAGQPAGPAAGVSAETPAAADIPAAGAADSGQADGDAPAPDAGQADAGQAVTRTSSDLADGLVAVAESFLADKVAGADDPEIYQVVVHVGADVLGGPAGLGADPRVSAGTPGAEDPGVSAGTPQAPADARVPGDPADPARCHVEDGPAISVSTAQMVSCTAALSWMTHSDGGAVLALGRRRRRPSSTIRRVARERDNCRCGFPGCESRRVDLHHIQHWVNGGRTDLDNLISLCPWHHKIVHDRGYLIATSSGGGFTFYRPDGSPLPPSPPSPSPTAASRKPTTRRSPRTRSSRPGTASGSTWTTPSPSASPTPAPTRKSEPTRSRLRRPCSGRSHGAATSAPRSSTSADITTNTQPPEGPMSSPGR
jgi:hypothetical protein